MKEQNIVRRLVPVDFLDLDGIELWLEEMAAKGLDRDLITQAVAEVAPDPAEQLATIITKKYTPLPSDEKGRRRMHNALARMGYGWGEIRSAVARAEENTESWVEPDEQQEI